MNPTARLFLVLGCVAMFLGVALGAFGAHALRDRLPSDMLSVWRTAETYQFIHALGLLVVGLLAMHLGDLPLLRAAGWAMSAGIVLFSGSLYLLALTGTRSFGAVTPFGGLAFLAGWILLALTVWRAPR